jgi:hypothetical protein
MRWVDRKLDRGIQADAQAYRPQSPLHPSGCLQQSARLRRRHHVAMCPRQGFRK